MLAGPELAVASRALHNSFRRKIIMRNLPNLCKSVYAYLQQRFTTVTVNYKTDQFHFSITPFPVPSWLDGRYVQLE